MSETTLQTASSELVKQVRDANDLCHAAYNYFQKEAKLLKQTESVRSLYKERTAWGVILTILSSFIIIAILEYVYFGIAEKNFIVLCCFPISALLVVLLSNLYFRKYARRPLKTVEALKKRAQEERMRGEALFTTNHDIFRNIPEKYWFPAATGYILEMLKTGRASSLNEALDRTDEQLHRWKLEKNSNAALTVQIAQLESLKQIERNTFWDLI